MAIDLSKYVNVVSGVGAGNVVSTRELIGRLFTDNALLPPQSTPLEFTTAAAVGDYFGLSSEEYLRSVFYFSWISKSITRPKKISFARWVSTAVAPRIYGNVQTQSLTAWQMITAGSFGLTIGGVVNTFTALDFSAATSLSDVAAVLQTAIRTKTGSQWTAATVVYNSTRGSFDFVGGSAVAAVISVQEGASGTHIAATIGWLSGATLILANGSGVETLTATLDQSDASSTNFGSFLFIPTLSIEQKTEVATWTDGKNVKYQYMVAVLLANYSTYYDALSDFSGVGITISETSGEYPEQAPMMVLAATNYDAQNSVQNYEFQQFPGLTPSVTSTSVSDALDAKRINYYGQTQTAGQFLNFYQRGVLMGGATAPIDMNTFANEQWLKDAANTAFINLLLAVSKVSANNQGRGQLLITLQNVINAALRNGTISVNKVLSVTQKLYISEITDDENAWHQVQNSGYWVNMEIVPVITPTPGYQANYTLVYSKDDVIRKIDGTHDLI
jgi:hypothetical protein